MSLKFNNNHQQKIIKMSKHLLNQLPKLLLCNNNLLSNLLNKNSRFNQKNKIKEQPKNKNQLMMLKWRMCLTNQLNKFNNSQMTKFSLLLLHLCNKLNHTKLLPSQYNQQQLNQILLKFQDHREMQPIRLLQEGYLMQWKKER